MMKEKKVGIVLVNYNGEKFQNECIRSIRNMSYSNYEIIVVDNDSKDKSIIKLIEEFQDIILIKTGENCGIAKGNNIGIKKALEINCEYILLLNNDTEVDKFMLSSMIERANKDMMVTCKMYYYEPKTLIWCAGGKFNFNKATTTHFGEKKQDTDEWNESKIVDYTPTCCLLIHKGIFEEVGLMDENYFLYYDDTDFIMRCRNKNIKIWYEATAKLWHKVSSSSGGDNSKIALYYGTRNRLYFINKYYKGIQKIKIIMYFYITRIVKCIRRPKNIKIYIKAIKDYYSKKMYRQKI